MAAVLVCWTGMPSPARGADDSWLGADKALHFSAGFTLSAGGYGLSSLAFDERIDRFLFGDQPRAPSETSSELMGFAAGPPLSLAVPAPVPDDLLAPSQVPRPVPRNLGLQERLQWNLDAVLREPIRVADDVVLHRLGRPLDAIDDAMERFHCVGQCARRWSSGPLGAL